MSGSPFTTRFGPSLNPAYHFPLPFVGGLSERAAVNPDLDPGTKVGDLRFHRATGLNPQLLERLLHD
jgi:hypothetical protein